MKTEEKLVIQPGTEQRLYVVYSLRILQLLSPVEMLDLVLGFTASSRQFNVKSSSHGDYLSWYLQNYTRKVFYFTNHEMRDSASVYVLKICFEVQDFWELLGNDAT